MKVKIFDMVLGNVPPGQSPSTHLEDQINGFLKSRPNLQVMATHMNTLVVPADPSSPSSAVPNQPSVIIFTTIFYQ